LPSCSGVATFLPVNVQHRRAIRRFLPPYLTS